MTTRTHGAECAGRCLTRAYAIAAAGLAAVLALHVACHW